MARNLVWILGGGTMAAAAAVAVWLAAGMQGDGVAPAGAPGASAGSGQAPAGSAPANLPADAPVAANTPQPPAPAPAEAPTVQDQAAQEQLVPPRFDVVRVARDGEALVAGSAAPGAAVTLRVDGAPVAEAAADGSGQFVAMFSLGSSAEVQVMTLEMADAAGQVTMAEDTVVLTPRPEQLSALDVPEPPAIPAPPAETGVGEEGVALPEGTPGSAFPEGAVVAEGGPAPLAEAPGAVAGGAPSDEPEPAAPEASAAVSERPGDTGDAGAETAQPAPAATEPPEPDSSVATAPALPEPAPTPAAPEQLASDAAPDMPTAFLLRGDGGVEVLDQGPTVMDNVVIESISYSEAGEVQISGRAAGSAPSADLRIYLDNRPIAVAQAERGDWRLDLPAIAPGIYTLRVDQLTPEGGVESRFETPFQREAPEVIAAARARAAGGNATGSAPTPAPEATASATESPVAPPPAPPTAAQEAGVAAATGGEAVTPPRDGPSIASRPEPVAAESTDSEAGTEGAGSATQLAGVSGEAGGSGNGGSGASVPTESGTGSAALTESASNVEGTGNGEGGAVASDRAGTVLTGPGNAEGSGNGDSGTTGGGGTALAGPSAGGTGNADSGGSAAVSGAVSGQAAAEVGATALVTGSGTPPAAGNAAGAVATGAPAGQSASADASLPAQTAQAAASGPVSGSAFEAAPGTGAPRVSLITVQPGHTLWHISRERYGAGERYVIIYRANRGQIRDPDLIYPGQVFTLPEN